jgi:CRP/FNR family transcriptional regulator
MIPQNISPNGFENFSKELIDLGTVKKFNADSIIVNENSNIKSIPIVLSGSIKVLRSEEDGREILLYYIKPGESCIMSLLGGIHYDTSKVKAMAEEDAEILFIPVEKMKYLIKENFDWIEYIFKLYHKRFEELLEVINEVAFKKMDERLLNLLNKKTENLQSKSMHITHEQLANELGTSRVVVSRLLKQLEDEQRVILGRNKITLCNKSS